MCLTATFRLTRNRVKRPLKRPGTRCKSRRQPLAQKKGGEDENSKPETGAQGREAPAASAVCEVVVPQSGKKAA